MCGPVAFAWRRPGSSESVRPSRRWCCSVQHRIGSCCRGLAVLHHHVVDGLQPSHRRAATQAAMRSVAIVVAEEARQGGDSFGSRVVRAACRPSRRAGSSRRPRLCRWSAGGRAACQMPEAVSGNGAAEDTRSVAGAVPRRRRPRQEGARGRQGDRHQRGKLRPPAQRVRRPQCIPGQAPQ